MYPNGFVPFINGDLDDRYGTLGYRHQVRRVECGLLADLRLQPPRLHDRQHPERLDREPRPLAGGRGVSANSFGAGGFAFRQLTTNADFSRFYGGVFQGLNAAFGLEYRRENYKIFAGEPGSYIDADGVGVGGNAGSQGFPGFQPGDATDRSRHSTAAYIDLEADITDRLKLQGALRHERFSDFGSTTDGKLAAAFKLGGDVLLRGSVSTGFRAPSLQQVYFSSTFTDFVNGEPLDVVLAPNGGAVANAAGIPALKEEKSKSATFGATWTPSQSTSLTADLYRIDIDDRIVLSGRFDAENYPALGATLQTLGVGQAQFFVNSVDTKPRAWTSPPRSACRWRRPPEHLPRAELQQDRSDRRARAERAAGLRGRAAVGARAPVHRTGRPAPQGHARLRVHAGQVRPTSASSTSARRPSAPSPARRCRTRTTKRRPRPTCRSAGRSASAPG
jgi:iron complex outermembrane receptor protein